MEAPLFVIGESSEVNSLRKLPFGCNGVIHFRRERGVIPYEIVVLLAGFKRWIPRDVQGAGFSGHGIKRDVVALLCGPGGNRDKRCAGPVMGCWTLAQPERFPGNLQNLG